MRMLEGVFGLDVGTVHHKCLGLPGKRAPFERDGGFHRIRLAPVDDVERDGFLRFVERRCHIQHPQSGMSAGLNVSPCQNTSSAVSPQVRLYSSKG